MIQRLGGGVGYDTAVGEGRDLHTAEPRKNKQKKSRQGGFKN